ncbi:PREDICTED: NADH dehydrogenase [ubiquinone] iron-sulfur protein 6, mitochondrial [Nanorana parkeri]|uniref:NADH dehydrogenase [ubiquinone] iron-sulfur protein 6, mitochondrial n=1 Tax=Nanorana parkeri TaxID=125878 RepID=UPI0008543B15|nr:PREDICTED: NADH dehydrogenase [ubiquinone] iron-sulfur protein 6, mitochondrial [Nanorana parkeri]
MAASLMALGRVYVRGVVVCQGWGGGTLGCTSVARSVGCVSTQSWRHHSALSQSGEKVTHTGQVYENNDYRRVRFVGKQKEVNEQFAIELIAEQPVNESEKRIVSCDGGGGALGHPKVYINLDKETKSGTCGYCGLQFKQKHHH